MSHGFGVFKFCQPSQSVLESADAIHVVPLSEFEAVLVEVVLVIMWC